MIAAKLNAIPAPVARRSVPSYSGPFVNGGRPGARRCIAVVRLLWRFNYFAMRLGRVAAEGRAVE